MMTRVPLEESHFKVVSLVLHFLLRKKKISQKCIFYHCSESFLQKKWWLPTPWANTPGCSMMMARRSSSLWFQDLYITRGSFYLPRPGSFSLQGPEALPPNGLNYRKFPRSHDKKAGSRTVPGLVLTLAQWHLWRQAPLPSFPSAILHSNIWSLISDHLYFIRLRKKTFLWCFQQKSPEPTDISHVPWMIRVGREGYCQKLRQNK